MKMVRGRGKEEERMGSKEEREEGKAKKGNKPRVGREGGGEEKMRNE